MTTLKKIMDFKGIALSLLTLITLSLPAFAANNPQSAPTSASTKQAAKANSFVEKFIQKMVKKHKFSEDYLNNLFDQVQINTLVTEKISRPFEAKPWHVYRHFFITDNRIKNGAAYWDQHQKALKRAENKYGVPPSVIVAILGVETNYGENQGSFPVLETLTTLAFNYPARSQFFTKELEHYLLMTREQKLDPLQIYGSYAGAIGMPQFMPSSYRSYAVDFSGKHQVDLSHNHVDAIGSIANFLHVHGWQRHGLVASKAKVTGKQYQKLTPNTFKLKYTVKNIAKYGISPTDPMRKHARCFLVELNNKGASPDEYWLGFKNFYVISRYNHSHLYVMAVHQLADAIKQAHLKELAQRHQPTVTQS